MEKILSQEEIDALLKGMEEGKVDTEPDKTARSGLVRYDFANQDRIIRGRMATLEMINDHFARHFRNSLSMSLRKVIEVSARGIEMVKFGEFLRSLSVPASLHLFKMDPLRGHAILALDPKLVFTLLDLFLGGAGKLPFRIEGREFTAVEMRLIGKITQMAFSDLEKSWRLLQPITIQYTRSEMNPQFVTIVPPTDLVISITFGVEIEQFNGAMQVCIPYANIEPLKTKLYSGFQSEHLDVDPHWVERFLERVKEAEVEVKVELGKSVITVEKLLQLKPGDVLPLGKDTSDPLVCRVEGIPKFLGKAGLYGANKAFLIERPIGASS